MPWSLIGPGWFLAEWAPTAPQHSADISLANPFGTVLFLVDPSGGRYALASGTSIPTGDLVSWSGDGKRALFQASEGGGANPELTVLDMTSGTTTAFQAPFTGSFAAFTKPDGLAILTGGLPPTPAQRFDLNGVVQFRFPTSFDQGAPLYGGIDSPDGTELAFDATDSAGVALVSNQGQLLRYVPIPVAGLCSSSRWWSNSEVLVQCGPDAGHSLWLVPTDGSSPSQLASGNDAWQLPSGVYSTTGHCEMGACSFGVLKPQPDGTMAQVPVPLEWASGVGVGTLGAFENRLGIIGEPSSLTGGGSQVDGLLSWFDPQTGAVTPLLGGSVNGGSVNAALMQET